MSKFPSSPPVEPRPAATVILLRDIAAGLEVFMVRRHDRTSFMAGAHVFPGGRVDAGDRETAGDRWCDGLAQAAAGLGGLAPVDAVAYHIAAVRETFEETGILLARNSHGQFVFLAAAEDGRRFDGHRRDVHAGVRALGDVVAAEGLRVALDALVPYAHWVTPAVDTRRFDTRFFVTRVPPGQTPGHDGTETTHGTWIGPAEALARCRHGEIVLPPPTWTTLRELEPFGTVDQVLAWTRTRPMARREPQLLVYEDRQLLVLPGDPLSAAAPVEPPRAETRFELIDGRWLARSATGEPITTPRTTEMETEAS